MFYIIGTLRANNLMISIERCVCTLYGQASFIVAAAILPIHYVVDKNMNIVRSGGLSLYCNLSLCVASYLIQALHINFKAKIM